MTPRKAQVNAALAAPLEAVANLCEHAFAQLDNASSLQAIATHSATRQGSGQDKKAAFYRAFWPLQSQMIGVLGQTYRRYMRLALAHANKLGVDPATWAGLQLLPAVNAALYWMRDWYILACDGENQRVRHLATVPVVPGAEASISLSAPPPLDSMPWRAPAWLFGISLAMFGVGRMKQKHIPNKESGEKLGPSHSRLLLKGAKRVFMWELGKALQVIANEEVAAAGAVRTETAQNAIRQPNKRRGWQQREKLYEVIRNILGSKPNLQGLQFCAELDKRHAQPLVDWIASGEWRAGLTWKEAWRIPELQRKIRRVRQEAQKRANAASF
jgi:hypothetical protein